MIDYIKDKISGKLPKGCKRSPRWRLIRANHLLSHRFCAACGGEKNLEVHHIKPFYSHPELELEPSNLITLCESKQNGINCHLLIGHLGCFKSVNESAIADAEIWLNKITKRPK